MKSIRYDREHARELAPLLRSIARELEERAQALGELEALRDRLASKAFADENEVLNLVAEIATHKREVRYAEQELKSLGCSVVGTNPITIRIPGYSGDTRKSFVWQSTGPVPLREPTQTGLTSSEATT